MKKLKSIRCLWDDCNKNVCVCRIEEEEEELDFHIANIEFLIRYEERIQQSVLFPEKSISENIEYLKLEIKQCQKKLRELGVLKKL